MQKARGPAVKGGLLGTIATAAAGGLMSLTLMACYGVAYVCENEVDADGDGYIVSDDPACEVPQDARDCDDTNADINPGAEDSVGDGIDQNCDGVDGSVGGSGGGGNGGGGGSGGAGGSAGGETN